MNEHQNLTWDDIKEMFAETRRGFKETELLIKQNSQEMKERDAEYERYREEADKKMDKLFEKMRTELDKDLKELNRQVGGISKNNGDMAENFFFNAFRKDKIFMGEKYDRIHKGYFSSVDPYRYEYDIVFFNGTNIAIVEVKYKAKPENLDVDRFLLRVEHFKKYAKEYKNHNIILGVAAMSFASGFATVLHKNGIATIHPVGKKMIIYDKNVRVY